MSRDGFYQFGEFAGNGLTCPEGAQMIVANDRDDSNRRFQDCQLLVQRTRLCFAKLSNAVPVPRTCPENGSCNLRGRIARHWITNRFSSNIEDANQ